MPSVPRLNLSIFQGPPGSCDFRSSRASSRTAELVTSAPPSPRTASPEKFDSRSSSPPPVDLNARRPEQATQRPPLDPPSLAMQPPGADGTAEAAEKRKLSAGSAALRVERVSSSSVPGIRRSGVDAAPIRYSRSGNYINGGEMSEEADIYEYFVQFIQHFSPEDVLVYGRTRREAVQQYGHIRHFWLIELWTSVAFRYMFNNSMYACAEAKKLARKPGAQLLSLVGFNTNQAGWVLASDYMQAQVCSYRLKEMWPKYVAKPAEFIGPENFRCVEADTLWPMPFDDNSFDLINSRSLAYMVPAEELDKAFEELYRITKPGGVVELYFRLRDLDKIQCFGLSYEEHDEYEAQWKAALQRSRFTVRRAKLALQECWGSEVHYVSELILLYYRIVHLQLRGQDYKPAMSDNMLENLVRLEKPTGTTVPVTLDIYTLQKF